uniref:Trafficking protein particle complex subunit n=1 Tax=Arcella intermedia TaxID=1963864 RepID=A0A6B2LPY0_9EUKA
MYIFDRNDKCIFYREWERSKSRPDNVKEEEQLMVGLLKALKSFVSKTTPTESAVFDNYATSTYKLHYFESGTGIKFVLISDPKTASLGQELREIYRDYYVEYISKNPLYKLGSPINCASFTVAIDKFIKGLTSF